MTPNASKNQKFPTAEEAIKAITDTFSPEQLKKLEIKGARGDLISFEEQLLTKYAEYYVIQRNCREIYVTVSQLILKNKEIIKIKDFSIVFSKKNPEKRKSEQEEIWKIPSELLKLQKRTWIVSAVSALVAIISTIVNHWA